jgi:hypothetical protein
VSRDLFSNVVRSALFLFGIVGIVETIGFFFLQDWARSLVPWELNRMAGVFLSSICAASTSPMLWIALSREYAAVTGGAINFVILFSGFAIFSFGVFAANPRPPVFVFGVFCLLGCLFVLGLIPFGLRHPFQDKRRVPAIVRISFFLFFINLSLAGVMLVLNRPNVFPWQLTPQQSVLYGWIFLGAAAYFLYGVLRPVWGNAHGQLFGFLAYDLILIGPFIALLFGEEPFLLPNLVYYIAMLIYSGALGVYYLFLNRETRISFKPLPG